MIVIGHGSERPSTTTAHHTDRQRGITTNNTAPTTTTVIAPSTKVTDLICRALMVSQDAEVSLCTFNQYFNFFHLYMHICLMFTVLSLNSAPWHQPTGT